MFVEQGLVYKVIVSDFLFNSLDTNTTLSSRSRIAHGFVKQMLTLRDSEIPFFIPFFSRTTDRYHIDITSHLSAILRKRL